MISRRHLLRADGGHRQYSHQQLEIPRRRIFACLKHIEHSSRRIRRNYLPYQRSYSERHNARPGSIVEHRFAASEAEDRDHGVGDAR